jgi:hypothetical protein
MDAVGSIGLAQAFFIFFKSFNGGRHHKTPTYVNGLTEAGEATTSIGLY